MLALLEPRLNEFHWCTMGLDQHYEPDYMSSADSNGLQALIDYCQQNGRICPQPSQWQQLYELLPNKRRVGAGWEPSPPLILAAWWDTPLLLKVMRFREHLDWAEKHGALDVVDTYLRGLTEDQWFHGDD